MSKQTCLDRRYFFKKVSCGNDVTAFEVNVTVSNTKKIEYLKSETCLFYEIKKNIKLCLYIFLKLFLN